MKNPTKQQLYETARKNALERSPDGCSTIQGMSAPFCREDGMVNLNEYLLFHGCPYQVADHVARHGLDPQRGGEVVGAVFGRGTYFAQNASKSDFYTTCSECWSTSCQDCTHAEGERCLLIARVLLGESKIVRQEHCRGIPRAPVRSDGLPYDSLTALTKADGGQVDHMEFVIFKEQLSLVQYLVYYRHKMTCECHNCRYRNRWW